MVSSGCRKCSDAPIRGIITVTGCTMVVFCFGIEHTFSNMNPYMTSYLRNRSQNSHDVSYGDTLWVATGKIVSASFFMPVLCLLEQVIPSKICILIGAWTFSTANALTYFSINNGFIATIFTDGVLYAMGKALAYPVTYRMAFRWFPERKGVVSGVILACNGGSAFVLNQIITKFINPDNLSPDQDVNDNRYFTQTSLLDNVPYCFLLIGGILVVMSTAGVLIMTDPGQTLQKANNDKSSDEEKLPEPVNNTDLEKPTPRDLSPKETLKTCRFYNVWFMYFFMGFGLDIFGVLFKPYGETFITDDYFLSLVASVAAVVNAVGNLTWGLLVDRFSYKTLLMIVICAFGSFLSTMSTTEHGGKPMYLIWVCALNFSFSGVFVLLPIISMDMFGNKHMSVNYGLVHSAGIAFSLLSAILTSQLKDTVGWHGVFLIGAGMTIISFLLSVGIYSNKWDR